MTHSRYLAHGAILAALYAALTHLQNLLLPGSASWAVQLRLSEALCVLALFTPAAAPGLSLGCLIFNLTFSAALPLDFLAGTLATWLSCKAMEKLRGEPFCALLLPGLFNGLIVGGELSIYMGGGFWMNAVYVALGEWAVLLTLGSLLYRTLIRRGLAERLFH